MAPHLILAVAGLTSAWAVFSIIGGERQRVLQNVELTRRAAEAQAAAEAEAAEKAAKAASSAQSGKKPAR